MSQNDTVLPVVRAVAAVIVVVLVLAVIVLYLMPGRTERFWAWTINPSMTAMLMGAGYAAGAYFFTRVFFTPSWRAVTLGFLPITSFTILMLLATLLHWDRFNHSHAAFFGWTFLYVVTPVLVPALWLANRRTDPGRQPGEKMICQLPRAVLFVAGGGIALLAMALFVAPGTVAQEWPWPLSDLTARVVAAYLSLTGGSLLLIALDARWQAARVLYESLLTGSALIIVAIARGWDGLDPSLTVRWAYAATMVGAFVLLLGHYAWMQRGEVAQAVETRRGETA